ncbi:hypothetical protein VZT92_008156 [Zoarces viviparus]|uniref:Uncharacterized protein n=1 Tax=Zoarces viviparus TaxID=48416 RepID=A0AAW1FLW6_ZOAVI
MTSSCFTDVTSVATRCLPRELLYVNNERVVDREPPAGRPAEAKAVSIRATSFGDGFFLGPCDTPPSFMEVCPVVLLCC